MTRIAAVVASLFVCLIARGEPYRLGPGPLAVTEELDTWFDEGRTREIPVRLYVPEGDGPFGLVVFSPGVAGTRDDCGYLMRHWASYGYLGVTIQHPGSDLDAAQRAAKGKQARYDIGDQRPVRVRDVGYAIDEALRRYAIDEDRIAVAGHSLGATTAMLVAGTKYTPVPDGPSESYADARVHAAIAMSPPGRNAHGFNDESWKSVSIPVLWMVGTDDIDVVTHAPHFRWDGFNLSDGPSQYLATFQHAENHAFNDRPIRRGMRDRIPGQHDDILQITTAFLDATLGGSEKASAWLDTDGNTDATIERKNLP